MMALGAEERASLVGRSIGQYRIMEMIGRGGMGEVYRATDTRLNRPVAVKVLPDRLLGDRTARKRFLRETRFACRVVHPYVATVFDVVEEEQRLFLIMEYVEGRRLDVALHEDHPDLQKKKALALEMAEAIAAIHKAGLIHRDLKPSNVMVIPSGHVKVMDFGVAHPVVPHRVAGDGLVSRVPTETLETGRIGTLLYMSPEQVRGGPVDYRSDLFSFGVMLYEAISGQHPFARDSDLATATAIVSEPPGSGTEPKTLSESGPIRDVILRLLEKDPARRYPSAVSLVESLRSVLRGEAPVEIPAPAWVLPRKTLAAGAIVFAAALGLWLLLPLLRDWLGGARATPAPVRPAIIVLPFRSQDGDEDAALRGGITASLLRAGLEELGTVRVVGSARTDQLLSETTPGGTYRPGALKPLLDATSARYLVTGDLTRDDAGLVAAIEVYDHENPNVAIGFRSSAASLGGLVDTVRETLESRLGLPRGPTGAEGGGSVAAIESPRVEALLAAEKGRHARDRGRLDEAGRLYGEAVAQDPGFVRAHMELAKTLYQAGYVTRAREAVRKALDEADSAPKPISSRLRLEIEAVRSRVEEDRQGEERTLRKLTALHPDEAEPWAEMAQALLLSNRPSDAIEAIDRALGLSPREPSYHLQKASALRRAARLPEAEASLAEASRWDALLPGQPLAARILLQKGYLKLALKDFGAARRDLEQASQAFASQGRPLDLAEARRAIAQTFLLQGSLGEAAKGLEKAAQDFADAGNIRQQAVCLDTLGALTFQAGHLSEAEATLRRAVELTRDTGGSSPVPTPMLNLASVLSERGRFAEALPFAEEGLQAARGQGDAPRQATALLLLAWIKAARGDLEAGRKTYDEAIGLLSKDPQRLGWAHAGKSDIEIYFGDLGAALDEVNREIEAHKSAGQDLNTGFGYVRRARIRRLLGDRTGFEADMNAAETAARAAGQARDLVARCALERGLQALDDEKDQEAESWLRKALSNEEPSASVPPAALGSLGIVLCRTHRTEEGIRSAERALSEARVLADGIVARVDLAESLALAGRAERSRAEALRALDEAEAGGMLWETARAAGIALALPEAARPTGAEKLRERGRRAFGAFLEKCPGGRAGPINELKRIRIVRTALGA